MTFLEKIYKCHLKLTHTVESFLFSLGFSSQEDIQDLVCLLKDVRNSALFPSSSNSNPFKYRNTLYALATDCVELMELDCLYAVPDVDVPDNFKEQILQEIHKRQSISIDSISSNYRVTVQ